MIKYYFNAWRFITRIKKYRTIKKIMRSTDVPEEGLLCDLLWSDPDIICDGWELMIEVFLLFLVKGFKKFFRTK